MTSSPSQNAQRSPGRKPFTEGGHHMMEGLHTAEKWRRVLQTRREIYGLDLAEAAEYTGLSTRTLRRAEEDPEWRPTRETVTRLTRWFGEGWQEAGVQLVDPEEEHAAALARVRTALSRLARTTYRRGAVARGAADTVTLAVLGEPLPYLVLSGLLDRDESEHGRVEERLSEDDERELGFPERRNGEPVQRQAGTLQTLWRAAVRYGEALSEGVSPQEAVGLLGQVWDALDDATEDDVHEICSDVTKRDVQEDLALHRTALGAMSEREPELRLQTVDPQRAHEIRARVAARVQREQAYRDLFGLVRPRLAGPFWRAVGVWEEDPAWEQQAHRWSTAVRPAPEEDIPQPQ